MVNKKGLILSEAEGTCSERVKRVEGFTLIEAMISVGVISIVLPVIFGLFFISLRSSLRMKALKDVKNNGDFALSYISDNIRENAFKVIDCNNPTVEITAKVTGATSACFRTKTSKCFKVKIFPDVDDVIPLGSPPPIDRLEMLDVGDVSSSCSTFLSNTQYLTNDKEVKISNFSINIDVPDATTNGRFNTSLVTISFKVESINDPTTYLNYYSSAKIRNY